MPRLVKFRFVSNATWSDNSNWAQLSIPAKLFPWRHCGNGEFLVCIIVNLASFERFTASRRLADVLYNLGLCYWAECGQELAPANAGDAGNRGHRGKVLPDPGDFRRRPRPGLVPERGAGFIPCKPVALAAAGAFAA